MGRVALVLCFAMAVGCIRAGFDAISREATDGRPGGDGNTIAPTDAGPPGPDGAPPGLDDTSCDDVMAGTVFCDGAEDTPLSAWIGVRGMGSIVRETTGQYRGNGVLHAVTAASGDTADIHQDPFSFLKTGLLWIRAYVKIASGFPIDDLVVLETHEEEGPIDGIGVGVFAGDVPYVDVGTDGSSAVAPTATIVRDQWMCIQLEIDLDNNAGTVKLYIDEALVASATGRDTVPKFGFRKLVAGVVFSTQANAEVWVDEVVADTAPVSCD